MYRIWLSGLLATAVVFAGTAYAKERHALRNATVLLVRHAEKPKEGEHLSSQGQRRAEAYVDYFKSLSIDGRRVKIDYLFAAGESAHSNRSVETLTPLSQALGLKIHDQYENERYGKLADRLENEAYDGKTVLICWHHGKTDEFLDELGVKTHALFPGGEWPEEVFNWLVVLQFDSKGKVLARVLNENLLPGDAKHPAPK